MTQDNKEIIIKLLATLKTHRDLCAKGNPSKKISVVAKQPWRWLKLKENLGNKVLGFNQGSIERSVRASIVKVSSIGLRSISMLRVHSESKPSSK